MSEPATEELCTICNRDRPAHKTMHHGFSPPGQPSSLFEKSPEAPETSPSGPRTTVRLPQSGDPILRMVLLRAGVITVAQLDAVEEELRATGAAGYVPPASLG